MTTRREFLIGTGAGLAAVGAVQALGAGNVLAQVGGGAGITREGAGRKPLVVSTWRHGLAANAAAWPVLLGGGRALDAVETGVRVTECT